MRGRTAESRVRVGSLTHVSSDDEAGEGCPKFPVSHQPKLHRKQRWSDEIASRLAPEQRGSKKPPRPRVWARDFVATLSLFVPQLLGTP